MARTAMTKRVLPAPYAATPLLDLTALDAFDNVNGMTLVLDGVTHIEFNNPTGGAITVTITGGNDPYNRSKVITAHSIPAGGSCFTADFPVIGWNGGGGNLMNVDASATGLLYAAVSRSPGT